MARKRGNVVRLPVRLHLDALVGEAVVRRAEERAEPRWKVPHEPGKKTRW